MLLDCDWLGENDIEAVIDSDGVSERDGVDS